MSGQSLIAIFNDQSDAKKALVLLLQAGLSKSVVSAVVKEEQIDSDLTRKSAGYESIGEDATLGASIGGGIGVLIGASVIMATPLGPLYVAGALAATILGGTAGGTLLAILMGYSVTEQQSSYYEELLSNGKVLIFVRGTSEQVEIAKSTLANAPPHMSHIHGESSE